jgi:copper(I)-binding protein
MGKLLDHVRLSPRPKAKIAKSTTTPVRHDQLGDNGVCHATDATLNKLHWKILSIPALVCLSLALWAAETLEIHDPWTPEAPPGRMMAGFMTLHNTGTKPIVITGAESDRFDRVEIHTMTMVDGVMRMRRLERLPIAPGETIQLKSGGIHLMLIQPLGPLVRGDTIEITLVTEDGQRLKLASTVRPRQP